jgi:hypothetical protein
LRRRSARLRSRATELDSFLVGTGHNADDWQAAYDGRNAPMMANMGLSTKYGALYQQAAAMQLATTGEDARAQVVAARDTGTQINLRPVLEIDLLVMRDGQPPYPATVRQMVAHAQLGLIAVGSTVSVSGSTR